MKINEFVELTKTKGWMPIAFNDQNEKIKKELEIKNYLSIKAKKDLVEDIVGDTILYNNWLYKFNGIDQYVTYTMKTIAAYSNLELSDDLEEDYDLLCESGLLDKILRTFEDEFKSVLSLLQMQCDYILLDNSVTAHINGVLDSVVAAINKLSDSAVGALGKFGADDIKNIVELANKIK